MESINYKNVLCIGPSGNSEEAIACKNFIYDLLKRKVNVVWRPIKIDNSLDGDSELERAVAKTKNRLLSCSEIVLCCHPERWSDLISFFKVKEDGEWYSSTIML